jgi:hypothetical protein
MRSSLAATPARSDDAVLMRIVATGASATEVLEGFTWAMSDDQISAELECRPRGAAARLYDILKQKNPSPTTARDLGAARRASPPAGAEPTSPGRC